MNDKPTTEDYEMEVIRERDEWEAWCEQMAMLADCEKEWSSQHSHRDCVRDAIEQLLELRLHPICPACQAKMVKSAIECHDGSGWFCGWLCECKSDSGKVGVQKDSRSPN
jgi:hypothetical protein